MQLIDAIKRNDKVVHYLDMPIQHINDDILKRMGRRTTGAQLADQIELLRREIPDICLRTTLIWLMNFSVFSQRTACSSAEILSSRD